MVKIFSGHVCKPLSHGLHSEKAVQNIPEYQELKAPIPSENSKLWYQELGKNSREQKLTVKYSGGTEGREADYGRAGFNVGAESTKIVHPPC